MSKSDAVDVSRDAKLTTAQLSRAAETGNSWPLQAGPPGYGSSEAYEMQHLPLAVNSTYTPPAPVEPSQGEAREEPSFSFYRPRKNLTTHLLGVIFFLVLGLIIALTVFSLKLANEQKALDNQPKPQNLTSSTTISTTLYSTVSTTQSTTLLTTQTQISTQPTTLISTLLQPTTVLQVVTLQISLTSTVTQLSTVTQTSTDASIQSTSVSACWVLLDSICSNTTQVPPDLTSGGFGNCSSIYRLFYCGVIAHIEATGELIIPSDISLVCFAMRGFCQTTQATGGVLKVNPTIRTTGGRTSTSTLSASPSTTMLTAVSSDKGHISHPGNGTL